MTRTPARLATVLAAALLLTSVPVAVTGAATSASAAVDGYASYEPQVNCAKEALPGTEFLLRHLVRKHPGSRAISTLRACSSGSGSEHKDGRALDWGLDAANPRERKIAYDWLAKVFATDKRGNTHALARRMGIMYIIWDRHIYSAYRGFEKRQYNDCVKKPRSCSKTTAHRDHVHVSLSRAGAAAQTTFYRNRSVPSVPVLVPGSRRLDPANTAVARFEVPATGKTVRSDFKLTKGVAYRVVADGLVRNGPGSRISDAACTWRRGRWQPARVLRVGGTDPWGATCSGKHTYEATYVPGKTDFLRLRIAEKTPGDADGSLTFAILREDIRARAVAEARAEGRREPRPARRAGKPARRLEREVVTVPSRRVRGGLTDRALRKRHRYRVVVTGTAKSGTTRFDGQCVRYAGRWRPRHTLDLTDPTADHLSLYVQGVKLELRVPKAKRKCAGKVHRYVGSFKPVVNGRARVRVWDPYEYSDNSGSLRVVLKRKK